MMRWVIGGLLAVNLMYALWALGALAFLGAVPASEAQREPHRIEQQLRPTALKIGAQAGAAAAPAGTEAATEPAAPPAAVGGTD